MQQPTKLQADLDIVSDIDDLLEIENPEEGGQTRKIVSISSALELYQFGNAQSINLDSPGEQTLYFAHTINKILSLDYELLADIDYSTRKAQKFCQSEPKSLSWKVPSKMKSILPLTVLLTETVLKSLIFILRNTHISEPHLKIHPAQQHRLSFPPSTTMPCLLGLVKAEL